VRTTTRLATSGAVLVGVLAAACGGSPTAPTTPTTTTVATVKTDAPPTPDPAPAPTPTTTPPVPTPAPTPGPQKPHPTAYLDARIELAHWYGAPVVGGTFVIELWPSDVWIDMVRLDRAPGLPDDNLVALTPDRSLTFTMRLTADGTYVWTINGLAGQAQGTAVRR
jgi:hypothetical protein